MAQFENIFEIKTKSDQSLDDFWNIELQVVSKPFYGYGYGKTDNFYEPGDFPIFLDYFNVLGIIGEKTGYGLDTTSTFNDSPLDVTDFDPTLSYGWGFEYSNSIFTNSQDEIIVRATVTKNNIPIEDENVVFRFKNMNGEFFSKTDSNGIAEIVLTMDSDSYINIIDGWGGYSYINPIPINRFKLEGSGSLEVFATIYRNPDINDSSSIVSTTSTHTIDDNFFELNIYSYAYRVI